MTVEETRRSFLRLGLRILMAFCATIWFVTGELTEWELLDQISLQQKNISKMATNHRKRSPKSTGISARSDDLSRVRFFFMGADTVVDRYLSSRSHCANATRKISYRLCRTACGLVNAFCSFVYGFPLPLRHGTRNRIKESRMRGSGTRHQFNRAVQ